ncbi:MAG: pilin [Patescibacteria group bacterium]
MKKNLSILFIIIITLGIFLYFYPVLAQSNFLQGLNKTGSLAYPGDQISLAAYAANIIMALFTLLGIVFVALLMYGGYLYLVSGGSEDKIKKGKNTLTAAVIGIIIIFSGYTITYFITTTLESPGAQPASQGAYNPLCDNSQDINMYTSIACCNARYDYYKSADAICCRQTPFCTGHWQACGLASVDDCLRPQTP